MAVHYRTHGIIVKKEDRGEADQILTVYTENFGKLEILGKAIRKIKSKLRGGAELFYLSEIEFIQGKVYKTLTDTILIEKFKNLREDLRKLAVAYKISEAIDRLVGFQELDKKIWQLLKEVFYRLNSKFKIKNFKLIYYYFLWNLLSILGYHPELYNCSLCQKRIEPAKIYFNLKEGGIICPECFKKAKEKSFSELNDFREINSDIVKILRMILKKDWQLFTRLKIETPHQKMLADISDDVLAIPQLK